LSRYHQLLLDNGEERNEHLAEDPALEQHTTVLKEALTEQDDRRMTDIQVSLRTNALRIARDVRPKFVTNLIVKDPYQLKSKPDTLKQLVDSKDHKVKRATVALLSIIASAHDGTKYLLSQDENLVAYLCEIVKHEERGSVTQRFACEIVKHEERGSVTQRFAVGCLQKISSWKFAAGEFIGQNMVQWLVQFLEELVKDKDSNSFLLTYCAALVTNILGQKQVQQFLEQNENLFVLIIESLTGLLKVDHSHQTLQYVLMDLFIILQNVDTASMKNFDRSAIHLKVKQFKNALAESEEAKDGLLDSMKTSTLDLCDKIVTEEELPIDKLASIVRQEESGKKEQELVFESFPDEIVA